MVSERSLALFHTSCRNVQNSIVLILHEIRR